MVIVLAKSLRFWETRHQFRQKHDRAEINKLFFQIMQL